MLYAVAIKIKYILGGDGLFYVKKYYYFFQHFPSAFCLNFIQNNNNKKMCVCVLYLVKTWITKNVDYKNTLCWWAAENYVDL